MFLFELKSNEGAVWQNYLLWEAGRNWTNMFAFLSTMMVVWVQWVLFLLTSQEIQSSLENLASIPEIFCWPKEKWLLMSFWDHRKKIFSCTKQSIALRWSHTISRKLETEFYDSCAWFVNLNRLNSCNAWCQTTWEHMTNRTFLASYHVLIPSNIGGHSKLDKRWTNDEEPRKKKRAKIGEYRIEIGRVRSGLGFYCYIHSLTHWEETA